MYVYTHTLSYFYIHILLILQGIIADVWEKNHSKIVETDSSPIHCTLQYYFLVSKRK